MSVSLLQWKIVNENEAITVVTGEKMKETR